MPTATTTGLTGWIVAVPLLVTCIDAASAGRQVVFRSGVDVVTLNVTVTDRERRYLRDLRPAEFQVFENGRQQEVTFFQQAGIPLVLTVLLDTSASMRAALPSVRRAASLLVRQLNAQDLASVIAFDRGVQVAQDFTSDRVALENAIQRITDGSSTSLYAAVYVALKELDTTARRPDASMPRRRALVVVSDGEDSSSAVSFEDLMDAAGRTDVVIYAIRLGRQLAELRRPDATAFVLRRLADQTGGLAFFPRAAYELPELCRIIRTDLSNQYALAYVSEDPSAHGRFRQLAVLVDRPGAVARTRRGYFGRSR